MRISICIPTYNRAAELRVLLDSIAAQADHGVEVEVAISDNASTDDTADMIAEYRSSGLTITYDRLDSNQGFDRNLLNAVRISSGDYCWLCGSDDVLEPGALKEIETGLRRHPSAAGLSIGLQAYNADLSQHVYVEDGIVTRFAGETALSGRDAIVSAIGDRFGYMSSVIVRRDLWTRVVEDHDLEPYLNGYVHLYVLARSLDERSVWLCFPTRLIGYRTGNDSFRSDDEFARARLDIVGYDQGFGDALGRDSPAYHRVMRLMATSYMSTHFLSAKLHGVSSAYWRQAVPTTIAYYWRYPGFWLRTLPIAFTPRFMALGARSLYRRTIKGLRHRRLAARGRPATRSSAADRLAAWDGTHPPISLPWIHEDRS
jgi:abequosyltransferase